MFQDDSKMSGKPKNGWGGKRAGAGQPRKATAAPLIAPDLSDVDLARATLRHIALNGVTEGARVAAARDLWDRAEGKPVPKANLAEDAAIKPADHWGALLDGPVRRSTRTNLSAISGVTDERRNKPRADRVRVL